MHALTSARDRMHGHHSETPSASHRNGLPALHLVYDAYRRAVRHACIHPIAGLASEWTALQHRSDHNTLRAPQHTPAAAAASSPSLLLLSCCCFFYCVVVRLETEKELGIVECFMLLNIGGDVADLG